MGLLKKFLTKKGRSDIEKSFLEEITLTDEDQAYYNHGRDALIVNQNGYVYVVREFSGIDLSNPIVSAIRLGKVPKSDIQKFQPYGELKKYLQNEIFI